MKFSLADLEAFVAVADFSNFGRAAQHVHLSQPALSRRIGKLEGALGVRLFDRTTRTVSLTTVGRDFVVKARALLDSLEHSLLALGDVAASRAGEVCVACVPSAVYYFLPNVIRTYHARFPRIRVRIIEDAANAALAAVASGAADFGLNFLGAQDPDIAFERLLVERFVLACRRDHPLARQRKTTWSALKPYDYMTVGKSSGNRLILDLALADLPDRPAWFYEVQHVSTLLGLVEAGLGIAAVPQLAMPGPDHPTLVSVPLLEPPVTRTLGLVRRHGRSLSPAAQAFYDLVKTEQPRQKRRSR